MTAEPIHKMQEQLEADCANLSNRSNKILMRLSRELAPVTGKDFLTKYALLMSEVLQAEYFLIGQLNPYSNIMRTMCYVQEGSLAKNMQYSLDGTPCEKAIEGNECVYADNVADEFPRDPMLREMKARGYMGAPLLSASGETLGIIAGVTRNSIEDPDCVRDVLNHFRRRVAYALEIEDDLDRYSWVVTEALDGFWDWDVVTGGTVISKRIQTMLGYENGEGPYDLMQIETAIHPEDRHIQVEALKEHLNNDAPYDVKFRIKNKEGVYRWFRSKGKAIRNEDGKAIRMIGCFSDIHDLMMEAQREACHSHSDKIKKTF